ncbi:hypothetical protein EMIT0P228_30354 [Pseudomonas brassicacearum]
MDRQRLIQPQFFPRDGNLLRRGVVPQHHLYRGSGKSSAQNEGDGQHAQKNEEHHYQSLGYILRHLYYLLWLINLALTSYAQHKALKRKLALEE